MTTRRKKCVAGGSGETGITNTSLTKTAFSECVGLETTEFYELLQDATTPAALNYKFGWGALLLLPESKTK